MKTQNTGATDQQITPTSPVPPARRRWLAGIGAITVVILLVGLSALVFAQLKQHQAGQTTPMPAAAQWKQVLKGYTLTSLVATRSAPGIVYACAVRENPGTSTQNNASAITLLRSADFGDHWQDIGGSALSINTCQIAVNTLNSNEIYTVSYGNNAQNPLLLKHSQDGGKTWESIVPVMHIPSLQTPAPWAVQQIQVIGNRLFGMQSITPRALPVAPTIKSIPYLVPRLVTSVDGGHNWTIIDNQFAAQRLGVHNYAVDPTNPNAIYDMLGFSLLPINLRSAPTYDPLPLSGLNQELFKSSDGGLTWRSVLNPIPYGSQVQLAAGNPQVIYVAGTAGPLPLVPGASRQSMPETAGSFHLLMSSNGGSNWQNITVPSDIQNTQNWFISPAGQIYTSPTIPFSTQPTIIPGTVVPSTPVPFPTANPSTGAIPPVGDDVSRPSPVYRPASFERVQTKYSRSTPSQFIQRYDPSTNSWSNITRPPTHGFMLQLTPGQSSSGAILWFVGVTTNGQVLYRYIV